MAAHILIPLDGSTPAQHALEFACEIHSTSQITVLHVNETSQADACETVTDCSLADGGNTHHHQIQVDNVEELLHNAQVTAAEKGVKISTESRSGDPTTTIIAYAEEHAIDHIIIGIHGESDAKQLVVGTVARSVAHNSTIPVTVVQ
jgi:nucleotide-binding universal stress UspA family protein